MSDFSVIGYTADFPYINLELKNKEIQKYEMALIVCHIEELKKGMKVSRIYKTTKKGTSIKFDSIKNKKEAIEYKDKIQDMVDEYNNRHSSKTKVCSYCRKEIKGTKPVTIMIDEVEYDFHEGCDFIPLSHLIGAEGVFIGVDYASDIE